VDHVYAGKEFSTQGGSGNDKIFVNADSFGGGPGNDYLSTAQFLKGDEGNDYLERAN
jgi:hypothetical protein